MEPATRWIALLRGVNVGGIRITMAALRTLLTRLDLAAVGTLLASGNAHFTDPEGRDRPALTAAIESALTEEFGYGARIILIEKGELARVVDGYPLDIREGWHAYVTFCDDAAAVASFDLPRLALDENRVALFWEARKGDTLASTTSATMEKLANRKGGPTLTTRNLNTLRKLLEK